MDQCLFRNHQPAESGNLDGLKLIAVGANGVLLTSTDGLAWTVSNIGSTKTLVDPAIYDGKWWRSPAMAAWFMNQVGPRCRRDFLANALFVDGNYLLAAGQTGAHRKPWSNGTRERDRITDVLGSPYPVQHPLGLQASGSGNVILRRSPAGEWNQIAGGASGVPTRVSGEGFTDLGFAGGRLFALVALGLIASSSTGRAWQPELRANSHVLRGAVDVSGQLFAVGDSGKIAKVAGG